jgi:hypothetical protein
VPEIPLASIAAYAGFVRWGRLPYAGGVFDQPAALLDEMEQIHTIYVKHAKSESGGKRGRGKAQR